MTWRVMDLDFAITLWSKSVQSF